MKTINPIPTLVFLFLFTNISFGQIIYVGGDSCEAAIPIPVGEDYYITDVPVDDYWYSFTAPCTGEFTVRSAGGLECGKRIYSGVCGSLTLLDESTWVSDSITLPMLGGQSIFLEINTSWDSEAMFDVAYTDCDADSAFLDVLGQVYYDMNDNGTRDPGELGKYLNPVMSDPSGIFLVSGIDGYYFGPVSDLPDGSYEIAPVVDEHWRISSDSLLYTININDDFEQRDSLDFGMHPDTIFYEVEPDLVTSWPRCHDTINYYVNIRNTGTTIASGLAHLTIDDSLYYVTADILPDSIVGKNLYWSYENLFFNDYEQIRVELGTPDGLEDTIVSTLIVTVDSADVEMASFTTVEEQVVTCAYDPNDKTPTPLGEGEFGNIAPDTESIEYLVRFQNTGTDTAINVVIKDQLDENLDWYSITPLAYSHYMQLEMDMEGEVSFIFENIMLPDSNVNEIESHGFVKYRIDLKPDLPLGTSIYNTANIYFDLNPAVVTNTTVNTLYLDNTSIDELMKDEQLLVYPNPFTESTTIYFEEDLTNYSIQIVDLLGHQVYANNGLSGNQLEIDGRQFKSGMYLLILIDNDLNEAVSTAKLIVK